MAISNLFNKSFLTRLISGVVLVIILLLTFITGGYVIFGLTLILSLIGVSEIYKTVGIEKSPLGFLGYAAVLAYYGLVFNLSGFVGCLCLSHCCLHPKEQAIGRGVEPRR